MNRRPIQLGEILAIDPKAIQREADSIFVLFSPEAPGNEYARGVACVHIRGPLDHHAGFGDNYDAIRERAREAFESEDSHAVIFRIDSPGGAVSGLLDTVRSIRLMAEASEKRSIAYVDERAFSAAYALACACDEIVLPESGLCGSIGVISTMADQVEHDKAHGMNFVTIASGDRKTDGHIHVPISEDAVAAERVRVDELATQFFQMVRESRGLSVKAVRGFQAALFLGAEAETSGVADRVETFDQLFEELASEVAPLDTHGTPESVSGGTPRAKREEEKMRGYRAELLESLKVAKAALAKAKPAEKASLEGQVTAYSAALEAYKKVTEKHVEHQKTHEEDDGDEEEDGNETDRDDDEEDDEDDEDDKKSKKAASKSKATKAESDDEEEEARQDDEEEAKALLSIVRGETGQRGMAAQGALAGLIAKAKDADKLATRVARLEQEKLDERRDAIVKSALDSKRLTPAEAKDLRKRPMAYVDAFLAARPKSVVYATADDMPVPAPVPNSLMGQLPPDLQKQLELAAKTTGIPEAKLLESYQLEMQAAASKRNGAA